MSPLRLSRRAWIAAAALALLGLLVFLFVKTDASQYRDEAAALALLRELKDVDTRWDVDGLRMTDALSGAAQAAQVEAQAAAGIMQPFPLAASQGVQCIAKLGLRVAEQL